MTFSKGAALTDPSRPFNSSLDGNARRAIDIHEGDKVDEAALKDLIRAAVALNRARASRSPGERAASGKDLGAVVPGFYADIVAVEADPLADQSRYRSRGDRAERLIEHDECHA